MYKYRVKSVDHRNRYILLTLLPEDEDKTIEFSAGQYATLGFNVDGRPSPMRCFSFVGSPRNSELQFAMRPDGRYTSKVAALRSGDEVRLQGAFGHFVIEPEHDKHIVMAAAGIGITPFMSMLRWAADTQLKRPITLFFSNRDKQHIPFHKEILALERHNPHLRVVFIVDEGEHSRTHKIFAGKLSADLIKRVAGKSFRASTYLICGPQKYMDNLSADLQAEDVDPTHIITESFKQRSEFSWNFGRLSIATKTYLVTAVVLLIAIGAVTAFDLLSYVPKKAAAQKIVPATTSTQSTSTESQSTTPTTTTTNNNQNYQQPVSAVS